MTTKECKTRIKKHYPDAYMSDSINGNGYYIYSCPVKKEKLGFSTGKRYVWQSAYERLNKKGNEKE